MAVPILYFDFNPFALARATTAPSSIQSTLHSLYRTEYTQPDRVTANSETVAKYSLSLFEIPVYDLAMPTSDFTHCLFNMGAGMKKNWAW